MPRGAITALATPFRGGRPDREALRAMVEWQISEGIDGLLACGCTGEAATLTQVEHMEVVRTVVEAAGGRVPVMAGAGRNDTAATVDLATRVAALGVDSILLITPYYNKPTPAGQVEHFTRVADSVDCEVVLYNVPGRTGTNMMPETVAELAAHPRITAIKDAAGSCERVPAILDLCDITILSGDDAIAMGQVAMGAEGVVSVVANIAPAWMAQMVEAASTGELRRARELQAMLYPVIRALFIETNPIPVKRALHLMGKMEDELRLPLVPMGPVTGASLESALREAGLLA